MNTRIIGIDLAVTARHRAAILDPATGQFSVKELTFTSSDADLERLLARAQAGVTPAPDSLSSWRPPVWPGIPSVSTWQPTAPRSSA